MNGKSGKWRWQAAVIAALWLPLLGQSALADRVKDLAAVQGVRNNQLIGYGLVVGLDNTGDQTTQTPFTTQSLGNMLSQMGINLSPDQAQRLQLKNVAAVMLTAALPPFARPGQEIDVTVSSMGNAKSLRGGTLLMTQLKGADGQVYAVAQGNVLVGGVGASTGNSRVTVNHLAAGRIPGGATVER
ncbi:MAG: flagellar basal body P-ring protein FlgI, partial [Azonexus sp.]|nr:flagellar basal body P-ring protein FlgI [Azonexus sp.]